MSSGGQLDFFIPYDFIRRLVKKKPLKDVVKKTKLFLVL